MENEYEIFLKTATGNLAFEARFSCGKSPKNFQGEISDFCLECPDNDAPNTTGRITRKTPRWTGRSISGFQSGYFSLFTAGKSKKTHYYFLAEFVVSGAMLEKHPSLYKKLPEVVIYDVGP